MAAPPRTAKTKFTKRTHFSLYRKQSNRVTVVQAGSLRGLGSAALAVEIQNRPLSAIYRYE